MRVPAAATCQAEARSGGDAAAVGVRSAPRQRRWFCVFRGSDGASQARVRVPDTVVAARALRRTARRAQRAAVNTPFAPRQRLGLEWSHLCVALAAPPLRSAPQARSHGVYSPHAAAQRVDGVGRSSPGVANAGQMRRLQWAKTPMPPPPTPPRAAPRAIYTPGPPPGRVPRSPPPVYASFWLAGWLWQTHLHPYGGALALKDTAKRCVAARTRARKRAHEEKRVTGAGIPRTAVFVAQARAHARTPRR